MEKQRGGDPEEAEEQQRSGDEAKERPGDQTPQTRSSGDKRWAGAPDWNIRGGPSRRRPRPPDGIVQGQVAADAPDGNIRSGSSCRSRRPPGWNIQGQVAEDAPDWIIRGRARRSCHNPHDEIIRGEKGPDAQGRMVRGGSSSRSPHPPDGTGSSTKDNTREEQ